MPVSVVGILSTSTQTRGDQTIVTGTGEIDLATAPQLRQTLTGLIDRGRHRLVLDLFDVTFCDSTGLGVMVDAYKRIQTRYYGGHLRIVCGHPVLRILELTGLKYVFAVHSQLASACDD